LADKVCTIVLNWNGWRDTAACLSSLSQLRYENHEIIVVDNGSTDDSVRHLRIEFPGLTLIETGKNLGFAAGCNVGIRRAFADGADFVWLLNNDTAVDAGALQSLVAKAGSDERMAAVGSAIYHMQEPHKLMAWGGGRVSFLLGRSRHVLAPVDDGQVDYITGASLLLRRSALEAVGMLDEGFFFSWEDADLGFRLRRANWKLAVAGDSKVWHKETASLRGQETVLDTYFNEGASRFFRKHALVPQLPLYTGASLRVMKRLIAGDWKRARAVWAACRFQPEREG
jgi:GT2 family glycosyltransferase